MNLSEGIALGSFTLATLGFMYRMSRDISEIKKQVTNDLQHITETEEEKRGRVYTRLDSVKKGMDEKFTSKEVCEVRHTNIDNRLKEIGVDVKILVRNGSK